MQALGKHVLLDLRGCAPEVLRDATAMREIMSGAATAAGATILHASFNEFQPFGVSGVVVIKESHLTVHTWPEYGIAAVDIFTCGSTLDAAPAARHILTQLAAKEHSLIEFKRCFVEDG
ncbi:MAG: adenosylmethionine decarboxylase [Planctomycetota bacterium]